jgi:hypothetical protein
MSKTLPTYDLKQDIQKHIEWANIRLDLFGQKLTDLQKEQMEFIIVNIVSNVVRHVKSE